MALQKSYEDIHGSTHASAYAKIVDIRMNTLGKVAEVTLYVYKDAAARAAQKAPVGGKTYLVAGDDYDPIFSVGALDPADANPIKLAYGAIKAYPEWVGATDV
jgi:hypothetical protein